MSEKIFILDDDEEFCLNLEEILTGEGFAVVKSQSPLESLEKIRKKKFSLLLIDYLMPNMSGLDFIAEIRKTNTLMRIILMTAYSSVETAIDSIKKGANDFIAKPFKKDELLLKIGKNLQELKFLECACQNAQMDDILSCVSNKIRREVLFILAAEGKQRFMDLVRKIEIEDHTKINFHLKILLKNKLIVHKDHKYGISENGEKMLKCLKHLSFS